jgi:hypothetical protein
MIAPNRTQARNRSLYPRSIERRGYGYGYAYVPV